MEATLQALLVIMVLLLGTTLTIIGVQIFFILRDVRQNVQKLTLILDDFQKVSHGIANGADQVSELMEKLKGTLTLVTIGRKVWEIFAGGKQTNDEQD